MQGDVPVLGLRSTGLDWLEQRSARKKLKRGFSGLFEGVNSPAAVVEHDGLVQFSNSAWKENFAPLLEGAGDYLKFRSAEAQAGIYVAFHRVETDGAATIQLPQTGATLRLMRLGDGAILVIEGDTYISSEFERLGFELLSQSTVDSTSEWHDQSLQLLVVPAEASQEKLYLRLPAGMRVQGSGREPQLIDLVPVPMARLNAEGVVLECNRPAAHLLGDALKPGRKLDQVIDGLSRPIATMIRDVSRKGEQGRPEMARKLGSEADLYVQVSLAPFKDHHASELLAVFSDKTELKQLEAQFVQSQKMQAVGQLAGGVAHDFNNLLTAILGHTDLMLHRHAQTDPDYGDLVQIKRNVNRAAALVAQLLAFSRKQTLLPKVINLSDTLFEMTHLLNRLLGEKVRLSVDCANPLFPVRADERQIEQVIMNLVVNARDAMPDGGEVYLAARNEELDTALHRGRARIEKGKYVLVTVRDTGSGIPAQIIDNIFEPFFTTKRQGEGTGLGLSTAYGIVKQTEGFIFAENAQGGGAEFEIFIPAAGSAEVTPPKKREPAEAQNRPRRDNVRVLLVEDEAPVRSFVSRALAHRGFDVTEAATGEEALEICEGAETSFDLVTTDVIMPGLDGPGWAKRAGFSTSEAPIIFMSGYAEDDSEAALAEFANRYFLTNPFSLKELTELSEIALQECNSPLKASS